MKILPFFSMTKVFLKNKISIIQEDPKDLYFPLVSDDLPKESIRKSQY